MAKGNFLTGFLTTGADILTERKKREDDLASSMEAYRQKKVLDYNYETLAKSDEEKRMQAFMQSRGLTDSTGSDMSRMLSAASKPAENVSVDPSMPLSVRNNNPGNIKDTTSGTFRTFTSPEEGVSALDRQLALYFNASRQGDKNAGDKSRVFSGDFTISNIVDTWAPVSDGNQNNDNYKQLLSEMTGKMPDQPLDVTDIPAVRDGIIKFEGGDNAARAFAAPTDRSQVVQVADSGQIATDGLPSLPSPTLTRADQIRIAAESYAEAKKLGISPDVLFESKIRAEQDKLDGKNFDRQIELFKISQDVAKTKTQRDKEARETQGNSPEEMQAFAMENNLPAPQTFRGNLSQKDFVDQINKERESYLYGPNAKYGETLVNGRENVNKLMRVKEVLKTMDTGGLIGGSTLFNEVANRVDPGYRTLNSAALSIALNQAAALKPVSNTDIQALLANAPSGTNIQEYNVDQLNALLSAAQLGQEYVEGLNGYLGNNLGTKAAFDKAFSAYVNDIKPIGENGKPTGRFVDFGTWQKAQYDGTSAQLKQVVDQSVKTDSQKKADSDSEVLW